MSLIDEINIPENLQGEDEDMRKQCRYRIRRLSMDSELFNQDDTILEYPNRVGNDDVEVGNVIGSGGFSKVCEFKGFKSDRSLPSELSFPSERSICNNNETAGADTERKYYYAVKRLRDDLSKNLHKTGAMDLAVEAQFLTSLSHENIVSIQAMGDDPGAKDFCIIIDRVERTLEEEIRSWKYLGSLRSHSDKEKRRDKAHPLLHTHILPFALDIASALTYLHGKNILFRDLKPDNIGIDFDNNLKIFDFGLAIELRQTHYIGPNKYLVQMAGTRRYMSPEVSSGSPYGLPADVFSFAILLSEMVSQEKPFAGMSVEQHKRAISLFRRRPTIKKNCPKTIKKLIQSGWKQNPMQRPVIADIQRKIRAYLRKQNNASGDTQQMTNSSDATSIYCSSEP